MKNGRIYFFLYYIQLCFGSRMRVQLFKIQQTYGNQSVSPTVVVRTVYACASVCLFDPECCLSVYNPETHGCTLSSNLDPFLDSYPRMIIAKYQECQLEFTFPNGTASFKNYPIFSTVNPDCPGGFMPCPFHSTCGCDGKWTSSSCGAHEGEQSPLNPLLGDPGFYPYYQVPFESSTYTFSYHPLSFTEAKRACLSMNATLVEMDDVIERSFINCTTNLLAPNPPVVTVKDTSTRTPTVGGALTLLCEVATALYTYIDNYYWLKTSGNDTKIIRYNTDNNKYIISDAGLTILNSDPNDTGKYYCIATNKGGTSISTAVTVNVTGELPHVTVPKLSYFAISGQSVTLVCTVSLAQGVYWKKNSYGLFTKLEPDTYNVSKYSGSDPSQPSLTIFNVQTEDADEYTCFTYNTYGTSESSIVTLTVVVDQGLPFISVPTHPLVYSVTSGQNITLECNVLAAISVNWEKMSRNGLITTLKPDTYNVSKYSGSDPSQPSLTIFNVQTEDSAIYTCYASNTYGTSQSSFINLTVLMDRQVPVVSISRNVSVADLETTVTLECTVSTVLSNLKISWEKKVPGYVTNITTHEAVTPTYQTTAFSDAIDMFITSTGRPDQEKYRGATVENPSLTILNLDRTDAGEYRCRAMFDTDVWLSDPITLIVITPFYRWWIGLEVNYPVPRWLSGKLLSNTLLPNVYNNYFNHTNGECGALEKGAYQIIPKMECNKTSRFICEKVNY